MARCELIAFIAFASLNTCAACGFSLSQSETDIPWAFSKAISPVFTLSKKYPQALSLQSELNKSAIERIAPVFKYSAIGVSSNCLFSLSEKIPTLARALIIL